MLLEDRIRQSFNAALDEARGTLEAELQATLASVHDESERSRAAAAAEARSAAEAELTRAFDDEKAALAASHDAALQQQRSAAEAEVAAVREEADHALAAVRADRERDQQELQRAQHHADTYALLLGEADQARLRAADAAVDVARRALDGVKALDAATSLTEVLDALTAAAAAETGRAAMLVVKGDRLIGWRTTGFGAFDSQPRTIEATSDSDALMRAVATSRPVVTGSGPASSVPAFAGLDGADRTGIAVPLLVGGRVVAVVYADREGAASDAAASHAVIETAVRHAGRCLEALTVQRAVQARTSASRVSTPA
jgi:hypothetical protein